MLSRVIEALRVFYNTYFKWVSTSTETVARISATDLVEIIILSVLVYHLIIWLRETRAWALLKGLLILAVCIGLTYMLNMDTITFLINRGVNIVLTAAVIVFQPELRRALESLGEKKLFASLLPFSDSSKDVKERFSDKTINELVKASVEMGKAKTGALIVIEQNTPLAEYERTGIAIDSIITSQLLINIFEHNTPLHDGAVLVRGDRLVAATCYLPLSDNMELSKELGTRHRAGVGISEVTDSVTIIVSEETGRISLANKGKLSRNLTAEELKKKLVTAQNKSMDTRKFSIWKGKRKTDEEAAK